MAYQLSKYGNYGTGALGDVADDIAGKTINSYAAVTAINGNQVTIDNGTATFGNYETFTVGKEVMFHVSASADGTSYYRLGFYLVANITAVDGDTLTLSKDVTEIMTADDFSKYHCQLLTIAQFANLTLNTGYSINPPAYSASNFTGGIIALKCTGTLTFNGGHINTADKGIPYNSTALRPHTAQENQGHADTATYSAWENSQTQFQFVLNAGDGAAFIFAKTMICNSSSRIGNTAATGEQFVRGNGSKLGTQTAEDGVTTVPTLGGTPRLGGATILIAAETLTDFSPAMIAKYRTGSAGRGLGRCYIATGTESRLRNDEGLYAYDVISDPTRLMRLMNIKNFGDGRLGDATNVTSQLNNYARVTAISEDRKTLTYANKTTTGIAPITVGALVMVHYSHKDSTDDSVKNSGRFILANVTADTGTQLTIDFPFHADIDISAGYCQVISVAQYNNFTLNTTNNKTYSNSFGTTAIWDGENYTKNTGSIRAIAVKDTLDITNGRLIGPQSTFTSLSYARKGLAYIGNAQDNDRLPIGNVPGESIFILARNIIMNTNTRIGGPQSGAGFSYGTMNGGYCGMRIYTQSGSGACGGGDLTDSNARGSYGGSGWQGSHVFIVANTITGFNQAAISTGGYNYSNGGSAGAGYGAVGKEYNGSYSIVGTGGYNGGGGLNKSGINNSGESSGWAFIYCNHAVNQDTEATILL